MDSYSSPIQNACVIPLAVLLLGGAICLATPAAAQTPAPSGSSAAASSQIPDSADVIQARRIFKQQLARSSNSDIVFDTDNANFRTITYNSQVDNQEDQINLWQIIPDTITTSFVPGSPVLEAAWKLSYTEYTQMHLYYWSDSDWSQSDIESMARSLKVLVIEARQHTDQVEVAGFDQFQEKCQSWSTLPEKPPMPEDARAHNVLAENAYREKDLKKADNEYYQATVIYPCWPEGQFNLASIAGAIGLYPQAINHMNEYIFLAPNASDVQSSKDQILIWKDKMGQ